MAKKVTTRKLQQDFDYEKYMLGDPLMDLLRDYYGSRYSLDASKWRSIVDNDRRLQFDKKKKKINADKRYR